MEPNDEKETLFTGCTDGVLQEAGVKELQDILFPITPRKSMSAESYLSSTFLKKINQGEDGEEEDRLSAYLKGRDAKELFSKNFTLEQVGQLPRWPTECQVIDERIRHIPFKPCPLEPYYTPTGNEVQPKPVGEESGIVVYQYYPISAVNYFCRSSIGGSKFLLPTCPTPEVESLRFESRFESGNLAKAIKITANYYELYLRTDLYTNRHMQWYYFRITNMKKSFLYRFSIVNFTKEDSLYGDGMRPLMYSVKDAQIHSIGWRRCGTNITYFSNETTAPDDQDQIQYYTLSFTIEFPHDDDTIYFAHSYPYTYSDLQDYLLDLVSHPVKSTYTTLRLLCKTLAGNNVYYVTVTSPPNPENTKKKKAIVVTARVHPGESPSSWMMHGFLDFLTSESGPAKDLRDHFVFKLVPMLNPDGVIVGNNRCSLTGKDLNRQYRTVIRETYPSIWYTKLLIRRLVEDCGVAMYCDLHAHSRKHNIFMFGCENKRNLERRLYEQVFPLMLHKNASEKFSFESCKFRIQKCKEGTGRVVMWMMGIGNSFTMEASFGGSMLGSRSQTHFNTMDYEQMGKTFCQTLLDFYDEDPRKERLKMKIMNRLAKEGSNADEPANIRLSDYSSDGGDTTSSSEDECDRKRLNAVPETAPPPPTPVKTKRANNKKANTSKVQRKPLQMCKSNLTFGGGQQKSFYSTDYTTESDSDPSEPRRTRQVKASRRKKKKKAKKKPLKKVAVVDISDNEVQLPRDYTLVELYNESSKLEQKLAMRSHCRTAMDTKRLDNYQRLLEVQTKLLSLKNKLWFGVGDIDLHTPLSWGSHNMVSEAKVVKRSEKRKSAKKTQKPKEETKEKTVKRTKESLRRQTAVDIQLPSKPVPKLRKSKSFTENLKKDPRLNRPNLFKTINIGYGQEDTDQNVGGPSPSKGVTVKVKKLKKSKAAKSSNKHS